MNTISGASSRHQINLDCVEAFLSATPPPSPEQMKLFLKARERADSLYGNDAETHATYLTGAVAAIRQVQTAPVDVSPPNPLILYLSY